MTRLEQLDEELKRNKFAMVGPPGKQCNGDGTCLPARLHRQKVKCPECGNCSWDHGTETPNEAFCDNCGADYEGDAKR